MATTEDQPKSTEPPATQAPASAVEGEKEGYASELLAYRVVDNLGEIIARRVKSKLGQQDANLLLVDHSEYALAGASLSEIKARIALIEDLFAERKQEHQRLLEPPAVVDEGDIADLAFPTLPVLSTFLPALVDSTKGIVELFRSEYKTTARDVDVKNSPLLASVAGSLSDKANLRVFLPGFYSSKDSRLLNDLGNLAQSAAGLRTERDTLASELPAPNEKEDPGKPIPPEKRRRLAEVGKAVRDTDAALLTLEGFRISWTAPLQGQTQSKLEQALTRERQEQLNITHLLSLEVHSGGGESTFRVNPLKGDSVAFMGGAAVSFRLAKIDGEILTGNTYSQSATVSGKLGEYIAGNATIRFVPEYASGSAGPA